MSKPRYQLVADTLRAKIARGDYAAGAQLPTKAELMAHFDVALATLDRGLEVLRSEGIIETFQGVGTFVKTPPDPVATMEEQVADLKDRVARLETQMLDLRANLALPIDDVPEHRTWEVG